MSGIIIECIRCGMTTFKERGFKVRYLSDFHTFHLHHYYGRYKLGGKVHELSPGTVTLSPIGVPSRYDLDHPGRHLYVHFRTPAAPVLTGGPVPDPDAFYARQLTRIVDYSRSSGGRWVKNARQAALEEMVYRFLEDAATGSAARAEDPVVRAYDLLEERYAEPTFVPDLARVVGMSPNYLAKLFKERYGITLKGRLLEIRMERARYLLRNTDLPIREVGIRVGISDPQYFNKQFRRGTGCSPGRFRDRRG